MEKKKPHYPLAQVHRLIISGNWRFTRVARTGALDLGLDTVGALAVVAGLTLDSFYKSMTSYADHNLWHDVYHAPITEGRLAYVKITIFEGLVVVSFKEK